MKVWNMLTGKEVKPAELEKFGEEWYAKIDCTPKVESRRFYVDCFFDKLSGQGRKGLFFLWCSPTEPSFTFDRTIQITNRFDKQIKQVKIKKVSTKLDEFVLDWNNDSFGANRISLHCQGVAKDWVIVPPELTPSEAVEHARKYDRNFQKEPRKKQPEQDPRQAGFDWS